MPPAWLRIVRGTIRPATRRKRNDYLLMFLLRHYTEAGGRRVPVDALRSPAKRGTTRETTAIPAPPESAAATVADFAGVALDEQAQAQIVAVLTACAARTHALDVVDDPAEPHVAEHEMPPDHPDAIHTPGITSEDYAEPRDGDQDWRTLDLPDHRAPNRRRGGVGKGGEGTRRARAADRGGDRGQQGRGGSGGGTPSAPPRVFRVGKPLDYWTG